MTDLISYVANLAGIEVSEKEASTYEQQLSEILRFFDEIRDFDTDGIEPLVTPVPVELRLRPDDLAESSQAVVEAIVQQGPETVGNLYRVPPVV